VSVSISAPAGAAGRVRTTRCRPLLAPWLLILPSLALGILIIGYPFYEIIRLSVSDVSRFGLARGYAGLNNFRTIFADPIFRDALARTFTWVVGVVGGTIIASIPVALILRRDFYGRGLARTLIMLPWSISLAMAAVVWLWSFNADYGMVNASLQRLGVLGSSVQWMARPETAFPMEILVGIIVSIPFTSTILLGGLSSIPNEVYEAAAIDGAHGGQSFFYITLPLLWPFLNIAIVLNVISVFNSFPIIWIMTQGGPNNSTHILVTYLYELSFRLGRPGQAAAVALAMLAIVFTFTGFYLRMAARAESA
jgi:multiple sugar transport system permease protein